MLSQTDMKSGVVKNLISKREKEILQYLALGLSTKEVAAQLNISIHTVISHRKSIQSKLNAKNCFHLGIMSVSEGLINKNQLEELKSELLTQIK